MTLPAEAREWIRSRPMAVHVLMVAWPPACVVQTKPGVLLLVPAPGIFGEVVSYFEDGTLGVAAPITIPHPEHGFGGAEPGEMATAQVDPVDLVLVREGAVSREDVEEALR